MSWIGNVVEVLRKIVLMEDRMERLAEQHKALANRSSEHERRLTRIEAKFELLEQMASSSRRALPDKTDN